MSWFAVDDRFPMHRKVLRLRNGHPRVYGDAVALWTLAGSWACGQDVERFTGRVPVDVLETFGLPSWRDALDALVLVGLWQIDDGDCIVFHDWDTWNGTGSREHRSKEQAAVRQRALRLRKCRSGQHDRHCPTQDENGEPWECPKRAGNTGSRDPGTGRAGTGRDGTGSPTWGEVSEGLRTPESLR